MLPTKRIFVIVTWGNFLRGCRKGEAFCERPITFHRQQLENDKQNVKVAPPPGKISVYARVRRSTYFLLAYVALGQKSLETPALRNQR